MLERERAAEALVTKRTTTGAPHALFVF